MRWLYATLLVALAGSALAQSPGFLPRDIAARWLPREPLLERFPAGGQLERVQPAAILQARPVPFQDVELAASSSARIAEAPTTWSLPPFAQIGPPGKEQSPEPQPSQAPTFSEIGSEGELLVDPGLRPLPGPRQLRLRFNDFSIPPAQSQVCYATNSAGLLQLSVYGGSTSFEAERIFHALQAVLESPQPLSGFGEKAVLGMYREPEDPKETESEGLPFDGVEVIGKPRPDLTDPGLVQASKAPAFQEVSTRLLEGGRLDLSSLPQPSPGKTPRARRQYWVIAAYFPGQAITAEMVIDLRLGQPQDLVDLLGALQMRIQASR